MGIMAEIYYLDQLIATHRKRLKDMGFFSQIQSVDKEYFLEEQTIVVALTILREHKMTEGRNVEDGNKYKPVGD